MKLKDIMEEECFVCYMPYNNRFEKPIIICKNQHSACFKCVEYHCKKIKKCPQCSLPLGKFISFYLYGDCEQSLKTQKSINAEQIEDIQTEFIECYLDVQRFNLQTPQLHYAQLRQEARRKMKQGNYILAAETLKEAAWTYFSFADSEEFLGLGSRHELFCSELEGCHYYWDLHGEDLSLLDQLAICFNLVEYEEKVRHWYDRMHQKHPQSFKILFSWATYQQNNRISDQAADLYLSSLELNPHFYKSQLMLAFVYDQVGQQIEALRYAKKAILKDPQNIFALFILVKSRQSQHIGCALMEQFFQRHPDYIEAMLHMAYCYEQECLYDKSIELYQKCISKQPFNRLLDLKIGKCLAFQGNYEAALQYLNSQRGKPHQSDLLLALQYKGYCFLMKDEYLEATIQIDQRLALNKRIFQNQFLHMMYVNWFYRKGQFKEIIDTAIDHLCILQDISTLYRKKMYYYISSSYFFLGKFQSAIFWADKCSWQLKSGFCYMMLAERYDQRGNFEESIRFYKICCGMGYHRIRCMRRMAKVRERQERYEEALALFQQIVRQAEVQIQKDYAAKRIRKLRKILARKK